MAVLERMYPMFCVRVKTFAFPDAKQVGMEKEEVIHIVHLYIIFLAECCVRLLVHGASATHLYVVPSGVFGFKGVVY